MIPLIVYVLLVAHTVADFIVQSFIPGMGEGKSKSNHILTSHVLSYTLVLALALALYDVAMRADGPPTTIAWLAFNAVAHWLTDWVTSRVNAKTWPLRPITLSDLPGYARIGDFVPGWFITKADGNRALFWSGIGVDQLIHLVTLFVTANWWLV